MMMNKEDLKAKALKKFDVWPYTDSNTMVGCMSGDNKLSDWTSHTTDHLSLYWTVVYTRKEFETDKKLTTPKEEIYWDGKEELKVGMWFLTGGTEHKAVTQVDVEGFLVIEVEGAYIIQCASSIKPIDKRTPREKAIDDLKHHALGEGNDAAAVINLIINGKISGVEFTGDKA